MLTPSLPPVLSKHWEQALKNTMKEHRAPGWRDAWPFNILCSPDREMGTEIKSELGGTVWTSVSTGEPFPDAPQIQKPANN